MKSNITQEETRPPQITRTLGQPAKITPASGGGGSGGREGGNDHAHDAGSNPDAGGIPHTLNTAVDPCEPRDPGDAGEDGWRPLNPALFERLVAAFGRVAVSNKGK